MIQVTTNKPGETLWLEYLQPAPRDTTKFMIGNFYKDGPKGTKVEVKAPEGFYVDTEVDIIFYLVLSNGIARANLRYSREKRQREERTVLTEEDKKHLKLVSEGVTFPAVIVDISSNGIRFQSETKLIVGQLVTSTSGNIIYRIVWKNHDNCYGGQRFTMVIGR